MGNVNPPADLHRDSFIEEVRAVKREVSERFGNNVAKLADHLREIERLHADRVIDRSLPDPLRKAG